LHMRSLIRTRHIATQHVCRPPPRRISSVVADIDTTPRAISSRAAATADTIESALLPGIKRLMFVSCFFAKQTSRASSRSHKRFR
jgi:hypothetical protein